MTLHWNAVEVRFPWTMLAILAASFLCGQSFVLWTFLALLPHEMGHCLAARSMGYRVEGLTVYPYGAAMTLDRPLAGLSELAVAAAGPVASVASATLAAGLIAFLPGLRAIAPFVGASLLLAAVNCLPALPLDGGRMLRAGLTRLGTPVFARTLSAGIGVAIGVLLLAFSIYSLALGFFNASMTCMGAFVLAGSLREQKASGYAAATRVYQRQSQIRSRGSMRLDTVAVHEASSARDALKNLESASLIAVVDDDLHLRGTLAEGDLLHGMARCGSEVRLRDLLH